MKLGFSFLPIPEEIMANQSVSWGAKFLFGILAKTNKEELKMSNKYLAQRMNCGTREVRYRFIELNNYFPGIVSIKEHKGRVNVYSLNIDLIINLQTPAQTFTPAHTVQDTPAYTVQDTPANTVQGASGQKTEMSHTSKGEFQSDKNLKEQSIKEQSIKEYGEKQVFALFPGIFFSSLEGYFINEYKQRYGIEPILNYAKDRAAIKSRITAALKKAQKWPPGPEDLAAFETHGKKLIDFFFTTEKAEKFPSLAVVFSADTINNFKLSLKK